MTLNFEHFPLCLLSAEVLGVPTSPDRFSIFSELLYSLSYLENATLLSQMTYGFGVRNISRKEFSIKVTQDFIFRIIECYWI